MPDTDLWNATTHGGQSLSERKPERCEKRVVWTALVAARDSPPEGLLRDLEAEYRVWANLASRGRGLRQDDTSSSAFRGNGGDTSHFEACLL
jgi:hypothetical protein